MGCICTFQPEGQAAIEFFKGDPASGSDPMIGAEPMTLTEIGYVAHRCWRCGRDNVIVNPCGCDSNNLPTAVPGMAIESDGPFVGIAGEPPTAQSTDDDWESIIPY